MSVTVKTQDVSAFLTQVFFSGGNDVNGLSTLSLSAQIAGMNEISSSLSLPISVLAINTPPVIELLNSQTGSSVSMSEY